MYRRTLLKLLASGLVGHTLDIDKLLWVPGAKTIFIPESRLTLNVINETIKKLYTEEKIAELFNREDRFYSQLTKRNYVISSREFKIPLELKSK